MDSKTFNSTLAAMMDEDARQVGVMTDAFAAILREATRKPADVAIPSFGTFITEKQDETVVKDLSTGHRMMLPPRITMTFQPAAMLRRKLNDHE